MSTQSDAQQPYRMSQGYEILQPRLVKTYPVPCNEWSLLKQQIQALGTEPWFFINLGFVVLGVFFATSIGLLLGIPPESEHDHRLSAIWVAVLCLVVAALAIAFARLRNSDKKSSAKTIIGQMDLIEDRFNTEDQPALTEGGKELGRV